MPMQRLTEVNHIHWHLQDEAIHTGHVCRYAETHGEERKIVTTKGNTGGHLEFQKKKQHEINNFRPRLSFHTRFELRLVENAKHPDSS